MQDCYHSGVAKHRCRSCKAKVTRKVDGQPFHLCDECLARTLSGWNDHTSSAGWESRLKTKYGITVNEHAWMYLNQRGLCAICKDPERSRRTPEGSSGLVVDHDHGTGEVRALLCNRCNAGIGLLGDDYEWLHAAMWYIRLHREIPPKTLKNVTNRDFVNERIEERVKKKWATMRNSA